MICGMKKPLNSALSVYAIFNSEKNVWNGKTQTYFRMGKEGKKITHSILHILALFPYSTYKYFILLFYCTYKDIQYIKILH